MEVDTEVDASTWGAPYLLYFLAVYLDFIMTISGLQVAAQSLFYQT